MQRIAEEIMNEAWSLIYDPIIQHVRHFFVDARDNEHCPPLPVDPPTRTPDTPTESLTLLGVPRTGENMPHANSQIEGLASTLNSIVPGPRRNRNHNRGRRRDSYSPEGSTISTNANSVSSDIPTILRARHYLGHLAIINREFRWRTRDTGF